jgi:hypothetical protein
MSPRTAIGDEEVRRGRLSKAEQFADAAQTIFDFADETEDVADAYVTLCVHAGIAAADAICCARLGRYARGENHADAVALLRQVDADAARELNSLLSMKTLAGYSHMSVSAERVRRASRSMDALVTAARLTGR